MAAIPRNKILIRRKRLETKQNKIKALQEKLRKEEKRLATMMQMREEMKFKIVGRVLLKRMENDPDLREWFQREIDKTLTNRQERDIFELN